VAVPFELFDVVLKILGQNYNKTYTLEELTVVAIPGNGLLSTVSTEREHQAKVLDTLLMLESEGLITLNQLTDESCINLKGLVRLQIINFVN
jgi:hypothetical protein